MCENPMTIYVNGEETIVKCGKCDTCRREHAQEWAIKLINESKYHKKCSFITLTFSSTILLDKNSKAYKYGANPSFVFHIENSKEYVRKFIKRLRKHFNNKRLTYYLVGEYGDKNKRPHWHMLLFNENFEKDRMPMPMSKTDHVQYHSETLSKLWACGRISIEDCNPNNIIYISQYSVKKFKNNDERKKYKAVQSFSNRSKFNVKWVRRNPTEIIKGYIADKDGKKYRIPKSYLQNLKNSENNYYRKCYEQYENTIQSNIINTNTRDLIKSQKIKSEQIRKRNENLKKPRDIGE